MPHEVDWSARGLRHPRGITSSHGLTINFSYGRPIFHLKDVDQAQGIRRERLNCGISSRGNIDNLPKEIRA
jgi:hypothetical protein